MVLLYPGLKGDIIEQHLLQKSRIIWFMSFENPQISTLQLPQLSHLDYEPLEPAFRILLLLNAFLNSLFVSAIVAFLAYWQVNNLAWWMGLPFVGVLLGLWVYPFLAYPKMGLALRTHDIAYRSGVLWQSQVVMALKRIQHVEVSQGPLEKKLGLAHLKLYTAGGFGADLSIEGLSLEQAENIRQFVMEDPDVQP